MTDITLEQRARELLAAEYERDLMPDVALAIREGRLEGKFGCTARRALRAIAAALRLSAGADWVLVPREPSYPPKFICTGVRTENDETTTVYLSWTDECGGWYQWTNHKAHAKHFKTANAATAAAAWCPGPHYYIPKKSSIKAEEVEHPKAKQYRAWLAEAAAPRHETGEADHE